jgi:dTDP-4-dehydrorhamnose reductase
MVLKKIFLTGGSGTLGKEMIKNQSKHNINFVAPSSKECDITNYDSLYKHIHESDCSEILHSAAATNVTDIEKDATQACDVNVIGTLNIIKICQQLNKKMVLISTDYVFDGQKGDYKIDDAINPISKYAKTKAAAELLVRCFDNNLIIRTSFFGNDFPYEKAVADQYSTKDYVDVIAPIILKKITQNKTGIVNVGTKKSSTYEKAVKRKPSVQKIYLKDIDFVIPKDVSLFIGEK